MDEFRLHVALQRADRPLPQAISETSITLAKRKVTDTELDALSQGVYLT